MDDGSGLSFITRDGFLLVRFTGSYSTYEQSLAVLRLIADKCRSVSSTGLLIDASEMTGQILSVDRFRMMLTLARMLPPHVRVAVLVNRESHFPDYLLETILRKYGIEGAEFTHRDDAIAWLNDQRSPAQTAV
jgi:hypothetical protein